MRPIKKQIIFWEVPRKYRKRGHFRSKVRRRGGALSQKTCEMLVTTSPMQRRSEHGGGI